MMKNIACACPNAQQIKTNPYAEVDDILRRELKDAFTVNAIVNESRFCTNVPLGFLNNDEEDTVTLDDIFHRWKGKQGLYHLWVLENDYCDKHEVFSLRCLYVGKGIALKRAKKHIKEKWPDVGQFYISFYECSNRIAKYLEQLFLDEYAFDMNDYENYGTRELFAYWKRTRYEIGSETHHVADRFAERFAQSAARR